MNIKAGPQRWQEHTDELDVVVCFEERVFDNVVEDMRHGAVYSILFTHSLARLFRST